MFYLPIEVVTILTLPITVRSLRFVNRTLDDSNPVIQYSDGWSVSNRTGLQNLGGSHHLTDNSSATANFMFTGVAVYMLSPLYPNSVAVEVTIDNMLSSFVDLRHHSRRPSPEWGQGTGSDVVWRATGLENKEHTLLISFGGRGHRYAAVDGFIYTAIEPSNVYQANPAPSPSTQTSPSTTPIVIGAVVGALLGLLGIILGLLYIRYRQRILTRFPGLFGRQSEPYAMDLPTHIPHVTRSHPTIPERRLQLETNDSGYERLVPETANSSHSHRRATSETESSDSSFFPTLIEDAGPVMNVMDKPDSRSMRVRVGVDTLVENAPSQTVALDGAGPREHADEILDGVRVIIHQPIPASNASREPTTRSSPENPKQTTLSPYHSVTRRYLDVIVEVDSESGQSVQIRKSPRSSIRSNSRRQSRSRFRHGGPISYRRRPGPVGPRPQSLIKNPTIRIGTNVTPSSSTGSPSPLAVEIAALFPMPPQDTLPEASIRSSDSYRQLSAHHPSFQPEGPARPFAVAITPLFKFSRTQFTEGEDSGQNPRPLPVPPSLNTPSFLPRQTSVSPINDIRRAPLPSLPTRGGAGRRPLPKDSGEHPRQTLRSPTSPLAKSAQRGLVSLPVPSRRPQPLQTVPLDVTGKSPNVDSFQDLRSPDSSRTLPEVPSRSTPSQKRPSISRPLITIPRSPKRKPKSLSSPTANLAIPPTPGTPPPPLPPKPARRKYVAPASESPVPDNPRIE